MKITSRGSAAAVTALIALTILSASACSVTVTAGKSAPLPGAVVPHDEVARTISDQIAAQTKIQPPSVSCPQDLPARVGATTRCTLNAPDGTVGVIATVTELNGTRALYDFEVDQSITPAPKA